MALSLYKVEVGTASRNNRGLSQKMCKGSVQHTPRKSLLNCRLIFFRSNLHFVEKPWTSERRPLFKSMPSTGHQTLWFCLTFGLLLFSSLLRNAQKETFHLINSDNATLNSGKERFCHNPGETVISSMHVFFSHDCAVFFGGFAMSCLRHHPSWTKTNNKRHKRL